MRIYEAQHKKLADLLDIASRNATLLIPDLQRPYVWEPQQVIYLVDSLLRGWPFSTLLLWNLGDVQQDKHMIPSRTFWDVVCRVEGESGHSYSTALRPNSFLMVLDGQQRLQSLLLAFGSESSGMKLLDRDWKESLDGASPYHGRNARKHWSSACLYLDLSQLDQQLNRDPDEPDLCDDPDYAKLLVWGCSGQPKCRNSLPVRPANYTQPLADVSKVPGQYIRLARLWERAKAATNQSAAHLKELSQKILDEHGADQRRSKRVWRALRSLLTRLQVAQSQRVDYLELSPYQSSGFSTEAEYKNAIVNIFTRLNAGGRTLTREEITFAWIKSSWRQDSPHGQAADAIEKLRKALISADEELPLKTDGVVKMLSLLWSVFERNGVPVLDRDLLDGFTVQAMAQWLESHWGMIENGVPGICELVGQLGIKFNLQYRSINALTLIAGWRLATDLWTERQELKPQHRDVCLKVADDLLTRYVESWLVLSQWGGLWSKGTDEATADYAARLSSCIRNSYHKTDYSLASGAFEAELLSWLADLRVPAKEYVRNLRADDRNAVGMYRVALTIWQRLEESRRFAANRVLTASSTRKAPSIEVDHVISWKVWEALTEAEDKDELKDYGNSLGNCLLLTKTFNITKGKKTLDAWLTELKDISEFDADKWKRSLEIPADMAAILTDGSTDSLRGLCNLIEVRERSIKSGLESWVDLKTSAEPHHS